MVALGGAFVGGGVVRAPACVWAGCVPVHTHSCREHGGHSSKNLSLNRDPVTL